MGQALITRRGVPMLAPDVDDGYEQLINYTMLYDAGDECEEVTGGLVGQTIASSVGWSASLATKQEDKLYLATSSANSSVSAFTQNGVDLSDYAGLYAVVSNIVASGSATFGVYANSSLTVDKSFDAILLSRTALTANKTEKSVMFLDTTDINSLAYLGVQVRRTSSGTVNGYVYDLFLTKPDNIGTLCTKAGVSIPTSIESLLTDTDSLATIFNNEDAVKFMVAQCTGDFMVSVLNNSDAVETLKASPYLNLVVANPHWAKFAMMIPNAKSIFNFTMLYDAGDECTDVTGGWGAYAYRPSDSTKTASAPTITRNADSIKVAGASSKAGGLFTNNAIDYSLYTKALMLAIAYTKQSASGSLWYRIAFSLANNYSYKEVVEVTGANLYLADILTDNNAYFGICPAEAYTVTTSHIALFKSDDYTTLCTIANITAPSDLATLVADSGLMRAIMSNENAVKYLLTCTGDLMVSILNSTVAVEAILNNAYATTKLCSHPAWAKFIAMSPTCEDAGLDLLV